MILIAALIVAGAGGLAAQITLLRELLVVASGNELFIGVFLGHWLLLEALGCALGGRLWRRARRPAAVFAACQAVFALALPCALYAMRSLKSLSGTMPGEGLGLTAMAVGSFLILLCVCLPHGALFAAAGRIRPESGGLVYGWSTLGALAGGLLATWLLAAHLQAFRLILAVSSLSLLLCAAIDWRRLSALYAALALAAAALAASPAAETLHWSSVRRQWPGARVVFYQNSVYGNVTVLKSSEQLSFLSDGSAAAVSPLPNVEFVEELAHFPLLAHPRPRRALVLGHGCGGLLREMLKHPLDQIEYAELDPLLLTALARFPTPLTEAELRDRRVRIHIMDGRRLVKKLDRGYDVIMVGASRPANLQTNRLFTKEFFVLARDRLKADGLLAFSLPGSTAFMEPNLARLNACVLRAATEVFPHLRPLPGDTNIFLASPSPLRLEADELARRLRARKISASFVGRNQFAWRLEKQWTRMLRGFLAPFEAEAGSNADFHPKAALYDAANHNAMFSPRAARLLAWAANRRPARLAALVALAALLGLALQWRQPRARPAAIPLAVAATGLAAMVYNISLAFAFQALYGYVYLWIGLLISLFMAGAGAASLWITNRAWRPARAFLALEAALVIFSAALPAIFQGLALAPLPEAWLQGVFLALALVSGLLTGAQFPLACRLREGGFAVLYSCDLLGGWLGALAGAAALVPGLGLTDACLAMALLKLISLSSCGLALRESL